MTFLDPEGVLWAGPANKTAATTDSKVSCILVPVFTEACLRVLYKYPLQ